MKTFHKLLPFMLTASAVACSNGVPPTGDGGASSSGGSSSGSGTGGSSSSSSSGSSMSSGGSSSGSLGGLGSACTVPTGSAKDICAALGYACTPSSPSSTTGTCQVPGVNQYCQLAVGCTAGNSCVQVSQSPVAYACFQDCTTTTDCTIISSSCQKDGTLSICNGNTCGPNLPAGSPPASGPSYYAPCNAAATGDGMCLPYDENGVTIGLCFAAGPASTTMPPSCELDRVDGGTLCPLGTFCLPDPDTGHSACLPLCDFTGPDDAGPACAAGSYCLGIPGGPEFGFCLTGCSASSSTCAANESCAQVPGLDAGTVCAP